MLIRHSNYNTDKLHITALAVEQRYGHDAYVGFSDGSLYACGINYYMELGTGDNVSRNVFTKAVTLPYRPKEGGISAIASCLKNVMVTREKSPNAYACGLDAFSNFSFNNAASGQAHRFKTFGYPDCYPDVCNIDQTTGDMAWVNEPGVGVMDRGAHEILMYDKGAMLASRNAVNNGVSPRTASGCPPNAIQDGFIAVCGNHVPFMLLQMPLEKNGANESYAHTDGLLLGYINNLSIYPDVEGYITPEVNGWMFYRGADKDTSKFIAPVANSMTTDFGVMGFPDGALFTVGRNDYGQLGQSHFNNTTVVKRVPPPFTGKIKAVCALENTSYIFYEDGIVFKAGLNPVTGGSNSGFYSFNNIGLPTGKKITHVANSRVSIYVAYEDGSLYSYGTDNTYGQLGIGSNVTPTTMFNKCIIDFSDAQANGILQRDIVPTDARY